MAGGRSTFTTGTDMYAKGVGRYTDALAGAMLDRLDLREGDRALDVGCGPGAALAALAERLGPHRVAGVEPSEPFAATARRRVPGADVHVAAAESLPFEDGEFDVVISQLVVNFMTDAPRGVSEMARVSSRAVASCVWDYAGEMQMLRVFWDAALEIDPDAPDEGRTMPWTTPEELLELWTRSGLRDPDVGEVVVSAGYEDFDDYWAPFPSGIAPSGAYCASLPPERQEALRQACFRRLGKPVGPFELTARAWVVLGQTPL
jgi:ubiquinone/menaquinone biosynthesis C-methylase UbiE